MKKIVFAATGASGAGLFLKLVKAAKDSCEAHVIVSKNAMKVLETEENLKLNLDDLGVKIYDDQDLSAGPASGSFGTDAMIIAPCSTNTLSKGRKWYKRYAHHKGCKRRSKRETRASFRC